MRLPSVPPLELAQEPHPNLLMLPFAASFFCNIRHIKRIWRKRVGVEPTIRPAKDRIAGFEGRESHRTLFASASSIVERFPVSQGKLRRDGTPLRQLDGCGSTRQRDRKARDWYTLHSRRAWKGPRFFRRGAVAVPCLFSIRGVPRTHQEALLHKKG